MEKGHYIKGSGAKAISGHNAFKVRLNISKLWILLKEYPELKQSYEGKDGKNEFVDIEMWESKPEYQNAFSTHSVKVVPAFKKDAEKAKVKNEDDDLPF